MIYYYYYNVNLINLSYRTNDSFLQFFKTQLIFFSTFRFLPNMRFNVRFVVNRYPLKIQHRALEIVNETGKTFWKKLLFPELKTPPRDRFEMKEIVFFNKNIEQNKEQAQAVKLFFKSFVFEYFSVVSDFQTLKVVRTFPILHLDCWEVIN